MADLTSKQSHKYHDFAANGRTSASHGHRSDSRDRRDHQERDYERKKERNDHYRRDSPSRRISARRSPDRDDLWPSSRDKDRAGSSNGSKRSQAVNHDNYLMICGDWKEMTR